MSKKIKWDASWKEAPRAYCPRCKVETVGYKVGDPHYHGCDEVLVSLSEKPK